MKINNYKTKNGRFFFSILDKDGQELFRSYLYDSTEERHKQKERFIKQSDNKSIYVKKINTDNKYVFCIRISDEEIGISSLYDTEKEIDGIIQQFYQIKQFKYHIYNKNLSQLSSQQEESTPEFNKAMLGKYNDYLPERFYPKTPGFVDFHFKETGLYYFAFNNNKGQTLLRSEGYTTAAGRDNGIRSVIKNAALPERYKSYQDEKTGRYFYCLKAGNHQEIASSCPYVSEVERDSDMIWIMGEYSIIGVGSIEKAGKRWSAVDLARWENQKEAGLKAQQEKQKLKEEQEESERIVLLKRQQEEAERIILLNQQQEEAERNDLLKKQEEEEKLALLKQQQEEEAKRLALSKQEQEEEEKLALLIKQQEEETERLILLNQQQEEDTEQQESSLETKEKALIEVEEEQQQEGFIIPEIDMTEEKLEETSAYQQEEADRRSEELIALNAALLARQKKVEERQAAQRESAKKERIALELAAEEERRQKAEAAEQEMIAQQKQIEEEQKAKVAAISAAATGARMNDDNNNEVEKDEALISSGGCLNWLLPLLITAIIFGLLFFWMKGCGIEKPPIVDKQDMQQTDKAGKAGLDGSVTNNNDNNNTNKYNNNTIGVDSASNQNNTAAGIKTDTLEGENKVAAETKKLLGPNAEELGLTSGSIAAQIAGFLGDPDSKEGKKTFVFSESNFPFNSAKMDESAFPSIDELTTVFNAYPNSNFGIYGHIDNTENENYHGKYSKGGLTLSSVRARCLYKKINERGIAKKRMRFKGLGKQRPIVSNDTEAGRQRNRRIEIEVKK